MYARDIMTSDPTTAPVTATVGEVLATLYELDVRHLPIVDGSELVGICSDRDLRAYAVPLLEKLMDGDFGDKLSTPIAQVMEGDVISVSPETELGELIDMMLDQRIGAVPVVDDKTGGLLGIVSYIDVLKALRPDA